MIEEATAQTTTRPDPISVAALRIAGLNPKAIYRLELLRDCLRHYPHIELFTTEERQQLLFLRWRYDRGEYADDTLSDKAEGSISLERLLEDIEGTADSDRSRVAAM